MQLRNLMVCLSLFAGTFAPVNALADAAADRKAIQADYNKVLTYFRTKNFDGLMKTCTTDATFTDLKGQTLNRDQALAQVKQMLGPMKIDKAEGKITSLSVKGNTATATTRELLDAGMK